MPNRPPQGMPPPQGQGNEQLKGEIDEFLRRVSTRREGQPPQRGAPPQRGPAGPARPVIVARQVGPANSQDRRRRPAPVIVATAGKPVVAEVVDSRDDIDDHVKRFLDNRQFEQRADKLTSIDQNERQFDRQIQQTFAHDVGHLKPKTLAPPADDRSVSQSAPQVVDDQKQQNISFALLTGSNLINAVIVSEIMQRPEHRW